MYKKRRYIIADTELLSYLARTYERVQVFTAKVPYQYIALTNTCPY